MGEDVRMHAVVVHIKLDPAREEEAVKMLHEVVVPMSKAAPGFTGGYWARSLDGASGLSVEVFDTEEAARAFADGATTPPGAPATIESVEVMEIMATA
jgi:hypothetical protein